MATREIEIERRDRVTHGEYIARVKGTDAVGKLTWTLRNEARVADHTNVPPEMRGQGIAALLVEVLVKDARSEGFRVVPACSYVAAAFDRHPEWGDLRG